jgi:succinate dehydrogenase / fumarate reductase, cytochrome b subunit
VTDVTIAPAKPLVLRTSIGKKVAMATSGVVLVGFVIAHMVGNLKFFYGEIHFDEYAHFLRTVGEPVIPYHYLLWGLRGALLVAVGVHIWAAYSTTMQSRRARPVPYAHADVIQANYASRTMRWGGVILLLFIVFHILDLTIGTTHVGAFKSGKVYDNSVSGFQNPLVTISYTLAMGALCLHLFHGIWSMMQTFGRGSGKAMVPLKRLSATIAFVVCLGFLSMPWAVLLGLRP